VPKPLNDLLAASGTTIFTVMSALAMEHAAINLGQGFPDTEGPHDVVAAASAALEDHRNQYPPLTGVPELRAAVAAANRRFWGLEIDPVAGVVVTSGATEALAACLMALLNPGDEVIMFEPLYDTYAPVVRLLGAVPVILRLCAPDWALPGEELEAAFCTRTKAVLLNTPHNPTGKIFSREELERIATLCLRHDVYAICDEVYEHLVFSPAKHLPLMVLEGMAERTLRIGSAGKTFSLTGWKVGYVSGPLPLMAVVAKAHQNLTFTTPPNLQRAVAYGLGREDEYFAGLADALAGKRDRITAGLRAIGFNVLPADGSYFVIAGFGRFAREGEDDVAFARRLTCEAKVAVIPVSAFYAQDPPRDMIRFAFCKQDEVLDEALARLAGYLKPDS